MASVLDDPQFDIGERGVPKLPDMTLRDWFAGQALTGLLAHPKCGMVGPGFEATNEMAAREAYMVADAMLAARSATTA